MKFEFVDLEGNLIPVDYRDGKYRISGDRSGFVTVRFPIDPPCSRCGAYEAEQRQEEGPDRKLRAIGPIYCPFCIVEES